MSSKCILIPEYVDSYTRKQDKDTKEENHVCSASTHESAVKVPREGHPSPAGKNSHEKLY